MKQFAKPLGFTRRVAFATAVAGSLVLLHPQSSAAAKQQMYRNDHSIYYCADTCSGSGCCDPEIAVQ